MFPEAAVTMEGPVRGPTCQSFLANRERQDCEKQKRTSCGVAFAKGTCILLAVFVFSFGALLCAFLMNVTNCWALQMTAYVIATSATLVSLFFVAHVRTDSEPNPDNTSNVRRNSSKEALCEKPLRAGLKSQDWCGRPQQHKLPLPCVLSFPRPAPVHLSPPANSADMEPLMTFEGALAWSSTKSPTQLSPC